MDQWHCLEKSWNVRNLVLYITILKLVMGFFNIPNVLERMVHKIYETMELPLDIQSQILKRAELSIDTYLHFRKHLGLNPKRLMEVHRPPEYNKKI